MARYRCHKQVDAWKIVDIVANKVGFEFTLILEDHEDIPVTAEWIKKHDVLVGGYYVLYDDGYTSWSPASAFEGGYHKVEKINPKLVIDRKFIIDAVNPCNGKRYSENDGFFICAKDLAALSALSGYFIGCQKIGAEKEHLESITLLRERVMNYQLTHPDKIKIPDTDLPCEIDRCIGGKIG